MAIQVKPSIEIEGGKKITHCRNLAIEQDAFMHHTFRVEVPLEALEKKDEIFFRNSHKDLCGKPISISFDPREGGSGNFRFRGIITEVYLDNYDDLKNSISISGSSPDILLEDCIIKRTFLNKTLQQIFDAVLGGYAGNMLKKQIKPVFKSPIKYAVQYNESNYAFLSRMADEYGEWFFYNGHELVLGDPGGGKDIDFYINGKQRFGFGIYLRPKAKFQVAGYDYLKHTTYKGKSSSKPVDGQGTFGKFALDESESLFSQGSSYQSPNPVYSQNELDDFIKFKRSLEANKMILFRGIGESPDYTIGTVINAIGSRLEKGGKTRKENLGKYRIMHIAHQLDETGNYSCSFHTVPESAKTPPGNKHVIEVIGQPELATVTDNNDPDKLGRVKVEFNWPGDDKGSDWIRVSTHYAGGGDGKGMHFIPEKEAQVIVGYELNRPDRPFIISSLYPKKDGTRAIKGSNEEKIIYTKAGNQIVLIDKQGENSIEITNVNKTDTTIMLEFKDNGQISIKTKGKVMVNAEDTISIKATQKLTLESKDIEIKASNELKCEGTSKVSVKGAQVKMEADSTMEIKGGATAKVAGPIAEVSADGVLTLKGGIVKIN